MADYQALLDNKKEYIEHLYEIMIPSIIQEFQNIYLKGNKSNALQDFQKNLITISNWNEEEINDFYNRLLNKSGCNYFKDLLKGILVTLLKIYVIQDSSKKNIKLHIPNPKNFIHVCLKNCARNTWKKPHLFYHDVRSIERQHNLNIAEELFIKSINSTIRNALPMQDIFTSIDNEEVEIIDEKQENNEEVQEETDNDSEDISLNGSDKDESEEVTQVRTDTPLTNSVITSLILDNISINNTKETEEDEETETETEDEETEDEEETEEETEDETEDENEEDENEDEETGGEETENEGEEDISKKNIIINSKPIKQLQIKTTTKVVKKALDNAFY